MTISLASSYCLIFLGRFVFQRGILESQFAISSCLDAFSLDAWTDDNEEESAKDRNLRPLLEKCLIIFQEADKGNEVTFCNFNQ